MAKDDDNDQKADGSSVGCIMTTALSGKCMAQPPIDHFERLLKGAFLNYAYPVKHKLKNCDMMKNFMSSRSLTRGMELKEDPS
jgi:hypothetical protein